MLELTELERVRLENNTLRLVLLQQQLQQVQAERAMLIKQIEMEHPGSVWNEQRGFVQTAEPYPESTPH
jgi:hypothetical protein